MSAPSRLAAFLLVLVVLGAGGALLGSALDPSTSTAEPAHKTAEGGHNGEGAASGDGEASADHGNAADAGERHGGEDIADPQGLRVAADGYRLELDRTRWAQSGSAPIAFRILAPNGRAVREFEVEHAKRMHLIVVRRDMAGFQHLHPQMAADGTWRMRVRLPEAGTYRVFTDFSHAGTRRTLAADVHVGGRLVPQALPRPAATARTAEGLTVTLDAAPSRAGEEGSLTFAVRDGQRLVNDRLGMYLGAKGHLVALREGDLAYLHVHPDGDRLSFMGTYPSPGRYRLWIQFRYEGRVQTAAFTQDVRP